VNDEAAARLVPRFQQSGLLLDANLLLVFVAGGHRPAWLGHRKRLREYDVDDLDRIRRFVARFGRVVTTPGILTEVSNLSNAAVYDHERADYAITLRAVIDRLIERYPHSRGVAREVSFAPLGLTDASIARVARARRAFVLSADFDLIDSLQRQGIPALNYNHLREIDW